jgi:uncharacterized protein YcgI (DUF1989 family)
MTGYRHTIPGDTGWATTVLRGQLMRLTCLGDGANVTMLLYGLHHPLERLNVPDTLKAQMSACIRPPMVLMSDLGRAMVSVTASSLPWHDAICGYAPATRRLLLDELATYGLGRRDLCASVNWFSKVVADGGPRAGLEFVPGHARADDRVDLRAEQDLLVVLATAPHPMDPAPGEPADVLAEVSTLDAPLGPDDPCRTFRAESARALALAERSR